MNEVFVMKVVFFPKGFSHTSKDILPASCTSKPQISCTSASLKTESGLSNQEIYEGLVNVKERIVSIFSGEKEGNKSLNYLG